MKRETKPKEHQRHVLSLISEAHQGDELALNELYDMYKPLVRSFIFKRNLFLLGGTPDDLEQEGCIGMVKGIKDFNPEAVVRSITEKMKNKGIDPYTATDEDLFTGFENFLTLCIKRQLVTAFKTASRFKNIPINEYISLDRQLPDNDNLSLADLFAKKDEVQSKLNFDFLSPEEQAIQNELNNDVEKKLNERLSDMEHVVFSLYRENKKYKQMQEILNTDNEKRIDNALQRTRKKLEEIIQEEYTEEAADFRRG